MYEKKEYKNDGVLMGNINSPMVTFRCGITLDQAKDLVKYANEKGWINFDVMHTKNGKSIMKVIDPRLVAANANSQPVAAEAGGDGLPF
jgi:hypothetical protein